MSRPKSLDKDTGASKESSRPRPEPKLKQGLKREDSVSSVAPAQKKARLRNGSDPSTTKAESSPTTPVPLDPEQVELTGMLVEALATSRASSMDP
jgi:hypothetical protein